MTLFFQGNVIKGQGRGRHLGFPTLNIAVDGDGPTNGVYAVRVRFDGQVSNGVLHVGPRPTFHENDVSVEVHLIDFDGAVCLAEDFLERVPSNEVDVEILGRLRDVQAFDSPRALKKQIEQDIMQARSFF